MLSQGFGESMTPSDLIAELAAPSKAEKAEVVERLAQEIGDTWPGIEKTPGVCGGTACIVRTRTWVLEGFRRLGWNEANLATIRPSEPRTRPRWGRRHTPAGDRRGDQAERGCVGRGHVLRRANFHL